MAEKNHIAEQNLKNGVWTAVELTEGQPAAVTAELLAKACDLARETESYVGAVVCGKIDTVLAGTLYSWGADVVFALEDACLAVYSSEGYTAAIAQIVRKYKPQIMLLPGTSTGRDLAPRLAADLHTGLTADCVELAVNPEDHILLQTRPAFSGNLMAVIACPKYRPQMATIRPGVIMPRQPDLEHQGQLIVIHPQVKQKEIHTVLKETVAESRKSSIDKAKIIVAGGMGISRPEGMDLLQKLAERLGGAVAASRACVDAGWADPSLQVGQTGTTVHPDLYIACGISGAIQHIAGMRNSRCIVAVNRDPKAPIFQIADYGLVGDLYEIIPEWLAQL